MRRLSNGWRRVPEVAGQCVPSADPGLVLGTGLIPRLLCKSTVQRLSARRLHRVFVLSLSLVVEDL